MRQFSVSVLGSFGIDKTGKSKKDPSGISEVERDPFEVAGDEILSGSVEPGAWAKALLASDGNETAVQAAYIKFRVADLTIQATEVRRSAEAALARERHRIAQEESAAMERPLLLSEPLPMNAHWQARRPFTTDKEITAVSGIDKLLIGICALVFAWVLIELI